MSKKAKRIMRHTFKKVSEKEIKITLDEGYVVLHNISWDTDGQKIQLPKAVAVPKELLDKDFNIEMDGADFLSNHYGWCVKSFSFRK